MYADKKEKNTPQQKINKTGIPIQMKNFFEHSSGLSLDDVRVHYHSQKPMMLNAHAYTQGNQVYIGSGQEKHLGHELTHVIQQKQGRVKPRAMINGMYMNNDTDLEKEADTYEYQNFQKFPINHNIQNVIQPKLIYGGQELKTKEDIRAKIAEAKINILSKYENAIIGILFSYTKDIENEFTLSQDLIDEINSRVQDSIQEKRKKEEAKKAERTIYQKAIELYLYLKDPSKNLETKSANNLISIFKEKRFGFDKSYAEISKQSSVLANVIVHAMHGGEEYLFVEIHPKGGIHYGSYVLVNFKQLGKFPISAMPPNVRSAVPSSLKERYKLVLSNPLRYLGQEEESTTTELVFLQYEKQGGQSSDLASGKYLHESSYLEKVQGKKPTEIKMQISKEGKDFLAKRQENLFNERPINIQKSKAMLDKKYWDTMLYYSVHIMRNKKEIQMLKKKSGNDIQILSLEIDIAKLENIINRLKLQAIQNNLNSIKTELDIIRDRLNDIERRIKQLYMDLEKDTEEVL